MVNLVQLNRGLRLAIGIAVALCLAGAPASAGADAQHHGGDSDWLLFPTGQLMGRSDTQKQAPEHDYESVAVDVLLSHSTGRFRALAEIEFAVDEADVERLQLGWEFAENTLGWAGRFHQPASAWNTEHHHGQYLQTAITRPSIEHWEDDHGLIPQHIAGVLLESHGAAGNAGGLAVSLGVGAAPVLEDGRLQPVAVVGSNVGGHRMSWSGRVAYEPELLGEDSIGLVAAQHDVNVLDPAVATSFAADDARLDILGAFARLTSHDWRLQATYYYVDVRFSTAPQSTSEHFGAGYLQVERPLPARLTPYLRIEASADAASSKYVAVQRREFEVRRQSLGLRWDFAHKQALTLEGARSTTLLARFNEVRLQWSGVVP
jgi:hypothetical protein